LNNHSLISLWSGIVRVQFTHFILKWDQVLRSLRNSGSLKAYFFIKNLFNFSPVMLKNTIS